MYPSTFSYGQQYLFLVSSYFLPFYTFSTTLSHLILARPFVTFSDTVLSAMVDISFLFFSMFLTLYCHFNFIGHLAIDHASLSIRQFPAFHHPHHQARLHPESGRRILPHARNSPAICPPARHCLRSVQKLPAICSPTRHLPALLLHEEEEKHEGDKDPLARLGGITYRPGTGTRCLVTQNTCLTLSATRA